MTVDEVMTELAAMGSPAVAAVMARHGLSGPCFGVKVGDLKKLVKRIKKDHALAVALFETGNADAQYLAGQIADARAVTEAELQRMAESSVSSMVGEYMVAGLAADSPHGEAMGLRWIDDTRPDVCAAGWATLGGLVSVRADADLDLGRLEALLARVVDTLPAAPNRARYTMNGFVIAVGSYVAALTDAARQAAKQIGKVSVDMAGTACKVPYAPDYIDKVAGMGRIGKKRKTARC